MMKNAPIHPDASGFGGISAILLVVAIIFPNPTCVQTNKARKFTLRYSKPHQHLAQSLLKRLGRSKVQGKSPNIPVIAF